MIMEEVTKQRFKYEPLSSNQERNSIMATVNACVLGDPQLQTIEATTVADLRSKMELDDNYAVLVNAEPADDDDELVNGAVVTFTPAVKGG